MSREVIKIMYENDILNWYKDNKKILFERWLYFEVFHSVDCMVNEANENVYLKIAEKSIYVYLHSDNHITISLIADYLCECYENKKMTIDEISKLDKWDIIEAINKKW